MENYNNLCTSERVRVSERVKDGRTFATKDLNKAKTKAKEIGSYVYDLHELIKGRLSFWGYAVPKILLISFMFSSSNIDAQFLTTPKDDINTQFGFFVDPTFTDAGFQFGAFTTLVMHWGYIEVSASTYPKLGGVGYTDLVAGLGVNGHFGGFEPIRSYAGLRLGRIWREAGGGYNLAGGAIGIDWEILDNFFIGVMLFTDYREDQANRAYGDSDAYKRGLVTNNPLLQENGVFKLSISF